jgi:L-lactate dehydrogenase complex protein LldG
MAKTQRQTTKASRATKAARNLPESFARMAALLGADVVTSELPPLLEVVRHASKPDLGPVAVSSDLAGCLPDLGSLDSRDPSHDGSPTWLTAVTRARIGIAATGSILITETREHDRLLPILARRHVALLPAGSILPTLADAASILRAVMAEGARYCTFVSGPSRTADIEKILTIGAHGPQELIIVVVEGWEPGNDRALS